MQESLLLLARALAFWGALMIAHEINCRAKPPAAHYARALKRSRKRRRRQVAMVDKQDDEAREPLLLAPDELDAPDELGIPDRTVSADHALLLPPDEQEQLLAQHPPLLDPDGAMGPDLAGPGESILTEADRCAAQLL